MKILKKIIPAICFSLIFGLSSCRDMLHDINAIKSDIPEIQSLKLIEITEIADGSGCKNGPFRINSYETTFLLWHEILSWAKEHGYKFIKDAEAGKTHETSASQVYGYLPVTSSHPADIVVWCNAYSDKKGLRPVYYLDKEFTKFVKDAAEISNYIVVDNEYGVPVYDMTTGKPLVNMDFNLRNMYSDLSADGLRLPEKEEWQYAAQGAWKTTADRYYKYSGSNDQYEVASLNGVVFPGKHKPNGIGAYDMTGNVSELTLNGDTQTGCYGGHYMNEPATLNIQNLKDLFNIYGLYPTLFGFRIAQTIKK